MAGAKFYKVVDGKVDARTYNGYRRFAGCSHCHGPDGVGSTFAPSLLVERLPSIDVFRRAVLGGQIDGASTMPYVDDIYAYLQARADGALGREPFRKHSRRGSAPPIPEVGEPSPAMVQARFGKRDQTVGTSAHAGATLMRSGRMNGTTPNCHDFAGPISVASRGEHLVARSLVFTMGTACGRNCWQEREIYVFCRIA